MADPNRLKKPAPSFRAEWYGGTRGAAGVIVTRATGERGERLHPRNDLWDHSPTGFEWGCGGSGPAQLALAILADVTGDDDKALRLHQLFKWEVIARIGADCWTLARYEVETWVARHETEELNRNGDG